MSSTKIPLDVYNPFPFLPTPPRSPMAAEHSEQPTHLEQLAALRAFYESAQAWTTQTRANLSNRMEYIAKADALESTSLPSPSPSPSPPLTAATLAPTDVDGLCESTPDVSVTNLPLPREKASGPSTRWNRRKNSMKLVVELGSRAQRNRPSARQALSPSLRKPSDSGHPSQPGQPSGGIARLLELFDELMASRMENLQCTEEMLRDLHLIA